MAVPGHPGTRTGPDFIPESSGLPIRKIPVYPNNPGTRRVSTLASPIGSRWVFKVKPDGTSSQEARVVAQGFVERDGIDCGRMLCVLLSAASAESTYTRTTASRRPTSKQLRSTRTTCGWFILGMGGSYSGFEETAGTETSQVLDLTRVANWNTTLRRAISETFVVLGQ